MCERTRVPLRVERRTHMSMSSGQYLKSPKGKIFKALHQLSGLFLVSFRLI